MSKRFMLVAGETSGDALAAELVHALRAHPACSNSAFPPKFYGVGGSKMTAAGVDVAFDLTRHAVFGFVDVIKRYFQFRQLFNQIIRTANDCLPDVFIGVDFSGLNSRLIHALKEQVRANKGAAFNNWNPKFVQFVSPQVWASRADRAFRLEQDLDLLLSIIPFEKEWYARRTPRLTVEYVGHPVVDRLQTFRQQRLANPPDSSNPVVLLLPGSRRKEITRHLPVMLEAAAQIRTQVATEFRIILPDQESAALAQPMIQGSNVKIQVSGLSEALCEATMTIASSGTVTTECAFMGVPTVVLYRLSPPEYWIGKQIVTVKYIALVNIIADRPIFPEFIQHEATVENLTTASLHWLKSVANREETGKQLEPVIATFGAGGATRKAADAIMSLFSGR